MVNLLRKEVILNKDALISIIVNNEYNVNQSQQGQHGHQNINFEPDLTGVVFLYFQFM